MSKRWVNAGPDTRSWMLRAVDWTVKNPEMQEQIAVVNWAKLNYPKHPELRNLIHIPNEGKRSKAAGGITKAMGMQRGVSDLFLPDQRITFETGEKFPGLWIEMKVVVRRQHPKIYAQTQFQATTCTPEQEVWLAQMIENGYAATVCWCREQAQKALEVYLNERWVQRSIEEIIKPPF